MSLFSFASFYLAIGRKKKRRMDGPTELLTPGKVFKTIFMLGPATNGVSLIVFCHADTHTRKKQPTLLWYNDELTRLHKSCVFSEVHNDH